jgi:phosphoenolpyruvate synthase/pyruvate phosphate dikinase
VGYKSQFILKIPEIDSENPDNSDLHINNLSKAASIEINVPDGFIIAPIAYKYFLDFNNLIKKINDLLSTIHYERPDSVMQVSSHINKLILNSKIPIEIENEILKHYNDLGNVFRQAEVLLGSNKTLVNNENSLIKNIKESWAQIFDPKNLISANIHNSPLTNKKISILVKKNIKSNKIGKLHTLDLKIETLTKLNNEEVKTINNIGKKLKKIFYLPYTAEWIIHKDKIYLIDLKPST